MHPIKIKKLFVATSCSLVALCAIAYNNLAFAETVYDGFYLSGIGGIAFTPGFTVTLPRIGSGEISYFTPFTGSTPFNAGLAVGYKNGPFRYEGEFVYMRSNFQNYKVKTGITADNFSGGTTAYVGMANLFYNFDKSGDSNYFYLGGGVGYANVKNTIATITNPDLKDSTSSAFALQAILGYAYNFSSNFSVNIDYRYFTTLSTIGFTDRRFQNNLLNIGASYYFG